MAFLDSSMGRWRPQSGLFSDSRDKTPMSAHRAKCYGSPEEANVGDNLMVGLCVRFLRDLGLGVATEPPQPDDAGHVFVFESKSASVKRKLAVRAKWVIPPHQDSQQFFENIEPD